jgi:hypothetical protein
MPNGDSVGGPMAAVVGNTSKLSADDRAAIALYIKSLPPVQGRNALEEGRRSSPRVAAPDACAGTTANVMPDNQLHLRTP